ncbi:MAG: hypothetical protein R3322_05075 [Kiloniellales bacterium]|nr:hypothetical protein [Kiloniellales bacterium]
MAEPIRGSKPATRASAKSHGVIWRRQMKAALGLPITVALFLLTAVQTDEAKAEGCGHFFEHTGIFDGGGRGITVCGEQAALGWFNDRISSYVIEPNTDCVITEHVDFGGSYVYLHADQQAR